MSRQSIVEIDNVIDLIYTGKINYEQANKMLNDIENKYDRPFFLAKCKPQPRPWNKKYLNVLKENSKFAYRSKECILHMAEVSDEVHYKQRQTIKKVSVIAAIIILIGVATAIIVALNKK